MASALVECCGHSSCLPDFSVGPHVTAADIAAAPVCCVIPTSRGLQPSPAGCLHLF
jgi:hypothetical protein